MRSAIIVILILALLAVSGIAVAGDAADLARPHARRIVNAIETSTGWDCHYQIADRPDLFAVVIWCDK